MITAYSNMPRTAAMRLLIVAGAAPRPSEILTTFAAVGALGLVCQSR